MGADRLAFRARRALARATVEFGEHLLVRHGGRLHVADARAHVSSGFDCADYAAALAPVQRPPFGNGRIAAKIRCGGCPLWLWTGAVGTAPLGRKVNKSSPARRMGETDGRRTRAFSEPAP